ncbi:MAG: transcription repressor NadR [Clostridia bacterium]|nr:transcription repressor NadR [Clostridia bacterium]
MNAQTRRETILSRLKASAAPVSATVLAGDLSVSRQVIVGDIALLRAGGSPIEATPRGYVYSRPAGVRGQVVTCHGEADMERELNTLVDLGCVVEDVCVEHPIYGQLTGRLQISCRADVACFIEKVRDSAALPLSALTEGLHIHSLRCPDRETLEKARAALRKMGILQE